MRQKKEMIISREYIALLNDIKKRIVSARIKAARSVNKEMIKLYWGIGKLITETQARNGWGDGVVEQLALDLTNECKGPEGFSAEEIWEQYT